MKVHVVIEKVAGENNCSCYVEEMVHSQCGLAGFGRTPDAAIADLFEVRKEYIQEGYDIPELEPLFKYDLWAFFDKFPIAATSVASHIGINPSLMRQYISGVKMPSKKRIGQIQTAIREIGKEMANVTLV